MHLRSALLRIPAEGCEHRSLSSSKVLQDAAGWLEVARAAGVGVAGKRLFALTAAAALNSGWRIEVSPPVAAEQL